MARLTSLCVYCGSSDRAPREHLTAAYDLGRLIAAAGIRLIYGGGHVGLMGQVADGALAEGGQVTGIIPRSLHGREVPFHAISELVVVDSMHERKWQMAERADGFIVLPGGYGTLDEMFEILTWRQLGLHDKPIVLVDLDGYWAPIGAMIDRIIAENYAAPETGRMLLRVAGIEDVLPALARERG